MNDAFPILIELFFIGANNHGLIVLILYVYDINGLEKVLCIVEWFDHLLNRLFNTDGDGGVVNYMYM